jgi:hypothetical protein
MALDDSVQKTPFSITAQPFTAREGQFSPDVKWVAYQSDDSGRFEIQVQRFPDGKDKTRVSVKGGTQVRWRGDGRELFYVGLDGRLMAVPIQLSESGQPTVGEAAPLFMTHIGGAVPGVSRQQYVVSKDGQRFLMDNVLDDASSPGITLLLNWKPAGR